MVKGVSHSLTTENSASSPLRVTVVVCTRNRSDMVVNVLDDLLKNTYPAFRVLVVDQSTDDWTREIVSRYQRERDSVDYVPTATTTGIPVARNIGLINASKRGEIIAFTDDDCLVPPDWISRLAAEFAADPDLDALLGRILPFWNSEGAGPVSINRSTRRMIFTELPNPLFVNLFELGGTLNFAVRASAWQAVGPFDEGLRRGADLDYNYRILQKGKKLARVPDVLLYHRVWRTPGEAAQVDCAYHEAAGEVIAKHWLLRSKGSRLYALSRIWFYFLRPFLHGLVRLSPRRVRKSWNALQATLRGIRIAKERYQVANGLLPDFETVAPP
jgi:glycosyltransferase involved in cell wall biosynthesis